MSTVTSEVQIMNSALIKLGAEIILSPNDDNKRARLMKAQYPIVRDKLLRSHPWRFSTAYAELALISPTPDDIFDYTYVFQLPSDCARVFKTNLCSDANWTEVEGGRLATDASNTLKIKYGKIVTDVTKYDATFVEVLAWELAADTAYAMTQSTAMADSAAAKARLALTEARSFSAQVGSVQRVVSDDWLAARR